MSLRRNACLLLLATTVAAAPLAGAVPGLALAATEGNTANAPSAQELQQLVAPIALYPDPLVGLILAASQYPSQIVMAARYLKDNPNLKGQALTQAANQQPWDPSVKALTSFAPVLDNMDKNLSWTSALGDAYYNDPQGVMSTIQQMRQKAQQAGTLKSTSQQTVTVEPSSSGNQTIIIQPSNPQVIYVPQYNPTAVYGAPVAAYPGYSSADMMMAGLMGFGVGMLVGTSISGSSGWGCNWGGGNVVYNSHTYVSNTNNYYNHNWNNNNWNGNHPYHGYNNWTNQLKNQNWQQAKSDFNQDYPNAKSDFNQKYPNFDKNHPNWAANHPQSNPSTNKSGYGRQGGYGDRSGGGYNGWGRSGSGSGDRSGGGWSSRQSAFDSGNSGRSAFANSARGRWSSGGFGGGRFGGGGGGRFGGGRFR